MLKELLEKLLGKEKPLSREQAENLYYGRKLTEEQVLEKFKEKVDDIIRLKSRYSTCAVVEIDREEVLHKKEDLITHYQEKLGYDVRIIDLGKDWEESYMFISWKRGK